MKKNTVSPISFKFISKEGTKATSFSFFPPCHSPIDTKVSGTTFGEAADKLQSFKVGMHLDLVRLKKNPFDRNAVAIFGKCDGSYLRIGYVPSKVAEKIAPLIDKNMELSCVITDIVGGGDLNYGLRIRIS